MALISSLIILILIYTTNGQITEYEFDSSNTISSLEATCGEVENCIINCIGDFACFNDDTVSQIDGTQARNLQVTLHSRKTPGKFFSSRTGSGVADKIKTRQKGNVSSLQMHLYALSAAIEHRKQIKMR